MSGGRMLQWLGIGCWLLAAIGNTQVSWLLWPGQWLWLVVGGGVLFLIGKGLHEAKR